MNKSIESGCKVFNGIEPIYDEQFETVRFDISRECERVLREVCKQVDNFVVDNLPFEKLKTLKEKVDKAYNKRIKEQTNDDK